MLPVTLRISLTHVLISYDEASNSRSGGKRGQWGGKYSLAEQVLDSARLA